MVSTTNMQVKSIKVKLNYCLYLGKKNLKVVVCVVMWWRRNGGFVVRFYYELNPAILHD